MLDFFPKGAHNYCSFAFVFVLPQNMAQMFSQDINPHGNQKSETEILRVHPDVWA